MATIENLDVNLRGNTGHLDKALDGSTKKLQDFKKDVDSAGTGIASGAGGLVSGIAGGITGGLTGGISALASAAMKTWEWGTAIRSATKDLGELNKEAIKTKIQQQAGQFGIKLNDQQTGVIQRILSQVAPAFESIVQSISNIFINLSGVLQNAFTQWSTWIRTFTGNMDQSNFSLKAFLDNAVGVFRYFEFLSSRVNLFTEYFVASFQLGLERTLNEFKRFSEAWNNTLKTIGENFGTWVGALYESWMTGNPFRPQGMNAIGGLPPATKTDAQIKLEQMQQDIMKRIEAAWQIFLNGIKAAPFVPKPKDDEEEAEKKKLGPALKAVERGSKEELAIAARQNRDLFNVANRQLLEQKGMKAELMKIGQALNRGGIAKAAV